MKHYVPTLIFFLSLLALSVNAQQTENKIFHQIKVDTLHQRLEKIMIIGVGSTSSRIFLERLGQKLVDKFTSKGLKVEYFYMGKTLVEAKQKFDTLNNKEFDAFLVFTPKDTSFFVTKGTLNNTLLSSIIVGGNPNSRDRTYSVSYHQDFHVRLYQSFDKINFVWAGLINADCDLQSDGIYKQVSRLILNCFKKNKYI